MTDCCRYFEKYKGIFVPRCSCYACWNYYFLKHPGELLAAKTAIETIGDNAVKSTKGDKYVKAVKLVIRNNKELLEQLDKPEEKVEA